MFSKLAEAEDQLGVKAQSCLEKLPVGKAAELVDKVVTKGKTITNPDKFVTAAANKYEKQLAIEVAKSEATTSEEGKGAGPARAEEPSTFEEPEAVAGEKATEEAIVHNHQGQYHR